MSSTVTLSSKDQVVIPQEACKEREDWFVQVFDPLVIDGNAE